MTILSPEYYSTHEDSEENLSRLLNLLPEELRFIWRKKTDDMELIEAIGSVQEFIAQRNIAKEKIFTTIQAIENSSLQEEVRKAVRSVEQSFGNAELFVGNGSVAEVYYIPEAPHVCVKYLVNPSMAREHGNSFREEAEYLNHMHGFEVDGIRAPHLLFYHSSDFGTCFGMEKIDGKSINIITDNPESIDFLGILKKQNMNNVLSRMRNFITTMHRDLTARNIMVDKEGNWYVIDFGRARPIEIGDNSTDMSEVSDVPTAEGAIRALFAKIATIS